MGSTQWYYLSNNPNALERSSEQKVECWGEVGGGEKEREMGRDKRGRPREADKPHSPAQPASAHQAAAASPSEQSPVREGKKEDSWLSPGRRDRKGCSSGEAMTPRSRTPGDPVFHPHSLT